MLARIEPEIFEQIRYAKLKNNGCLVALSVPNEHDSDKNAYMMYAFLASQ